MAETSDTDTDGSLRDVIHAIGSAIFERIQPNQESAKIMKKHLLLAHAEVLKGCLAVVENELEALSKPAAKSKGSEKITIK